MISAPPHPTLPLTLSGQPDGAGQAWTAGQPDDARTLSYTPAGVPVFTFDYNDGAPLYLVTVTYLSECRRAYVVGELIHTRRIIRFAARLGYGSQAQLVDRIDPALLPAEELYP
jgi:hypothetical protein